MSKCNNCCHNKVCIDGANYKTAENCKHYVSAEDVVKVVRCKDCKYLKYDRDFITGRYCSLRNVNGGKYCNDDDFCSYGEKMDGEE